MRELEASLAIEQNRKRKPRSKRGRMLCVYRDKLSSELKNEVKEQKFFIPSKKVTIIKQLNDRINRIFIREDSKLQLSLFMEEKDLFTSDLTVLEYKKDGVVSRATFTGTIAQAKQNLRLMKGKVVLCYAHYTKYNDKNMRGFWIDLSIVKK